MSAPDQILEEFRADVERLAYQVALSLHPEERSAERIRETAEALATLADLAARPPLPQQQQVERELRLAADELGRVDDIGTNEARHRIKRSSDHLGSIIGLLPPTAGEPA